MNNNKKNIYEIFLENEENKKILENLPKEEQEKTHNFLKLLFNKAEEVYIKPLEEALKNPNDD